MNTGLRLLSRVRSMFSWLWAHTIVFSILILLILGMAFFAYTRITSGSGETRYVLGTVASSTLHAIISGSGQVSSSNELEVKPKVSGDVISVSVTPGQKVVAGTVIARIDSTDAQKSVRDAESSLESAQIALEKLKKPAEALTMLQAENAVANAEDTLEKRYDDSRIDISDAFLDFPNIIENVKDIELGTDSNMQATWNIDYFFNSISTFDPKAKTYRDDAYASYTKARSSYDRTFASYQSLTATADDATITRVLEDAYMTAQDLLDAVKKANTFIQFYVDTLDTHNQTPSAVAVSALDDLNTYTGTINGHLSQLLAHRNGLKSDTQSLAEKRASLEDTRAGTDALDLRSAQLNVTKAENALLDAQADLSDYTVRAPFAGTIGSVSVKRYDTAGSATVLATLITDQKMAELSMNEVDVSRLEVSQKAELTFDAVDGLKIVGTVAEIDTVGAVDQGVVSYAVKIGFDAQDSRIKAGMTVNADIETAIASGPTVPATAVKSVNGRTFVLVFEPPLETERGMTPVQTDRTPIQIPVETGISDDINTILLSGLSEGDQIVIRQTNGSSATTQQAPSIFGGQGGARPSGSASGAVRISR